MSVKLPTSILKNPKKNFSNISETLSLKTTPILEACSSIDRLPLKVVPV